MKAFWISIAIILSTCRTANAQIFFFTSTVNNSAILGFKNLTADLDGDGDLDIISTSAANIYWYKNDGYGNFGPPQYIYSSLGILFDFAVSDIDGDGDLDISIPYTGKIIWLENNGSGNFTTGFGIYTINQEDCISLCADDFDGDGDPDIVASTSQGHLKWYKNNGVGSFTFQQDIHPTLGGNTHSVISADIDGDGDLDVLSASSTTNKIFWYKNTDGLGTFGTPQSINTNANGPRNITVSDLDGDGDLDLIGASQFGNKIFWHKNLGGSFGPEQLFSSSTLEAFCVSASDIDGDGDMDVVVASNDDKKISWFENTNGLGSFGTQNIIFTTSDYAFSVSCADIDGDGDDDIISGGDLLHWHKNLGAAYNEIKGTTLLDLNANGCTSSTIPMQNLRISTNNGIDNFTNFSQNSGTYNLFPNTGVFSTNIPLMPPFYTSAPLSYSSNFPGYGNTTIANFCLTPTAIVNDVAVLLFPKGGFHRPGTPTRYELIFYNQGTTQLSGDITVTFNNTEVTVLNSTPIANNSTSNSVTFNYSNLNPFERRTIDIIFSIAPPPAMNIGDILSMTACINPAIGDYTPADNCFTSNAKIVAAWDPNDITCLEGDIIPISESDEYLHYLIRFQNTGTSYALKVKVTDILDNQLDWSSLQLDNTSHNCQVQMLNGQVDFIFDAIYLPDSTTNEPGSHGYIAYKIKPKSSVSAGDVITNQANIYFDYNAAVITNTATTEFLAPLPIELLEFTGSQSFGQVTLNWTTATEQNNKGFVIQKSMNGLDWENIHFAKAQGTTTSIREYNHIDKNPSSGSNYYRLKQVDFGGTFKYSKIIHVLIKQKNEVWIKPNPTSGKIILSANIKEVIILNNQGHIVQKIAPSNQRVDITNLPTGLYFFQIKTDTDVLLKQVYKE